MMVSYGIGLAVGVAGIVALVHARRDSRLRVAWGIVGVALLALAVVPFAGMRTVFSQGATEDIVARSQPLIAALARCEADHGEYPAALSELVPRYLPAIPSTGYGPIREFHYYRAGTRPPKGEGWDRWPNPYWEMWVGEAPYALVVLQVPRGTLVYRPTHDYRDLPGGRHLPGTLWGHTGVD